MTKAETPLTHETSERRLDDRVDSTESARSDNLVKRRAEARKPKPKPKSLES